MGVNFESREWSFFGGGGGGGGGWGGFGPLGGGGHEVLQMKNFKPEVGISGNV